MKNLSKKKRKKLIQATIILILLTLFSSCKSTPIYEINELLIETCPPNPYKADGSSYITLDGDVVMMDLDYYLDFMEYVIKIEEYKLILDGK